MKIPSKRFDLTQLGYEGYYIEAPQSVKEGWFNRLAKETRVARGTRPEERDPEQDRLSNLRVMELCTGWNLVGDDDQPFPLIKDLKSYEEKTAVLAEIPLDVILHVVKGILGGQDEVPEKTRDFSSRS